MSNLAQQRATTSRRPNSGARIPPHSVVAEESVLGAILIDNETINAVLEVVRPQDFYRPSHVSIFQAMQTLCEKREPIDVVTLANGLKAQSLLDESGGFEYLAKLAASVPSAANAVHYANIVKELSLRRKVIHTASEIIDSAFEEEAEISEFMDGVETKILALSDSRERSGIVQVGDIVQDSIRIIEELLDKKELVTGVASGFIDLDKLTAGYQPSDLIVVAARPSMGKTSFALGIAAHAAIRGKRRGSVALFSLEMSKEQLVLRLLCSEASVDNSRVRTGHLGERDFPNLMTAAAELAEAQIYIDDTPAITPTELRAKCRRIHRDSPLSLIIVDYLQLMRNPHYSKSREQEISNISRSLKALAKELNVPVIALSQLNRSVESRNDKRPLMSDLRESGAIEQDADIITFIYRDEVYNPESADKGTAEIIIAKQRNGPTGTVRLAFSSQYTRFDNLAYDDELESYSQELHTGMSVMDIADVATFDEDPLF